MLNNLAKYKDDLKKLVDLGFKLEMRMQFDLFPKEMRKQCKEGNGWDDKQVDQLIKNLPSFKTDYQKWHSESLALIKQIIPDRLGDFKALYAAPSNRKDRLWKLCYARLFTRAFGHSLLWG